MRNKIIAKLHDKNFLLIFMSLLLFTAVIITKHMGLNIFSDDEIRYNRHFDGLFDIIKYYWNFNGRMTTDVLAELLVHHFALWIFIDCSVYLAVLFLIAKLLELHEWYLIWMEEILILMFPFSYWESAGFVSTTTNYLYPLVALLLVMLTIKNIILTKHTNILSVVTVFLGITYLGFSEQYVVVCIIFLGYAIFHMISNIASGINVSSVCTLLLMTCYTLALFCAMYFSPGHQLRMSAAATTTDWLPQFADWTFQQKALEGFTTTVANVIFYDNEITIALCVALAILAIKSSRPVVAKFIGILPLLGLLCIRIVGANRFIIFYPYSYSLPDIDYSSFGEYALLGFTASAVIVIAIFAAIILLAENPNQKVFLFLILFAGAVSREIMGFSATIYASSFRTFTLFLFLMIIAFLDIMKSLKNSYNPQALLLILLLLL